jgi:NhaP-type Na+/H+ and K+/H+ antiporter
VIARPGVWIPGLILGAALAFLIRPVLVGLCLIPARLRSNQRNFVLFAGLKGAVPADMTATPDRRSSWAAPAGKRNGTR